MEESKAAKAAREKDEGKTLDPEAKKAQREAVKLEK